MRNLQFYKNCLYHCMHAYAVFSKFTRGHIFSHVRPFFERAVSNLDRSMHISLWVKVAHSSFIEGSHATKNTASGYFIIAVSYKCKNVLQSIPKQFCNCKKNVKLSDSFYNFVYYNQLDVY
jgi:hypothetical protein